MERFAVDGAEIEYEITGSGEPVVLIHGGLIAEAFKQMATERAVADYQVIRIHRRGYAGSTGANPANDIPLHAADAASLLRHLGVGPAHVVGHCYGGCTALQLAMSAPETVHTLSLLEAPLPFSRMQHAEKLIGAFEAIGSAFASGAHEEAVALFVSGMIMSEPVKLLDDGLGRGVWDQMVTDAVTAFASDLPSVLTWDFTDEDVAQVTQPAQYVYGSATNEQIRSFVALSVEDAPTHAASDVAAEFQQFVPQLQLVELDGLNHSLQMQDPTLVAQALDDFITKHPIGRRAAPFSESLSAASTF